MENKSTTRQNTTPADPSQQNDQREVVEFVEDVSIQEASLPLPTLVSDELLFGQEIRSHNVSDIVTRTVKLDTFTWTSASLPNVDLNSYDFPTSITTASKNIRQKLEGFTFFRASVRVRILVNATRAQSGRLIAYFAPFSSSGEIGDRFDLNNHLSAKTAFPHIFLNAGVGNVGELVIPYVSYYSHYEVPNSLGDMGKLYVTVLNRLRSGASDPQTSCSVSVFAQFENPQIEVPTGMNLRDLPSLTGSRAIAQVVDESEQKTKSRVISSTLGILSDVAAIASPLPLIGTFMTPVSWALSAAAKIAHYAGFSKPITKAEPCSLYQLPSRGFTHADGLDQSVSLATSLENQIVNRRDVFGSSHDELDIKFICSHECLVDSHDWNDTAASGALIMQFPVTPMLCARAETDSDKATPTLLAYVSSMFRQWRGSLKYKIQVSKNVFHSGRLRVVFVPGAVPTTNYLTIDFNQCYSKVVDLVNADTIELTVPFVSNTLWKQVELAYADNLMPPETNYSTGMIYVEIINQLRRPEMVSDTIDLNLYISSDDIEFSIPDFSRYVPTDFTPTPPVPPFSSRPRALAQITGWDQDPGFDTMMTVSNPLFTAKKGTLDVVANSTGEQISNLRYLTRRFAPIADWFTIDDHTLLIRASSAYFGRPSDGWGYIPPIEYVSYLYRFFRGSKRFKVAVFADSTRATEGLLVGISEPASFDLIQPPTTEFGDNALKSFGDLFQLGARFMHAQALQLNNFLEVTLPYYSNTYASLLRGIGGLRTEAQDSQSFVNFRVECRQNTSVVLLQAGGDDLDYGWLIGPPYITPRSEVATAVLTFVNATVALGSAPDTYLINGVDIVSATPTLAIGANGLAYNAPQTFVTAHAGQNGIANVFSWLSFSLDTLTNVFFQNVDEQGSPTGALNIATTQTNVQALGEITVNYYPKRL